MKESSTGGAIGSEFYRMVTVSIPSDLWHEYSQIAQKAVPLHRYTVFVLCRSYQRFIDRFRIPSMLLNEQLHKKWAALLLLMLLCAVLSGIAGCRSGGQSAYAEPANYVDPRLVKANTEFALDLFHALHIGGLYVDVKPIKNYKTPTPEGYRG